MCGWKDASTVWDPQRKREKGQLYLHFIIPALRCLLLPSGRARRTNASFCVSLSLSWCLASLLVLSTTLRLRELQCVWYYVVKHFSSQTWSSLNIQLLSIYIIYKCTSCCLEWKAKFHKLFNYSRRKSNGSRQLLLLL